MKNRTMKLKLLASSTLGIAALAAGCVERRVVYVPSQPQPVYAQAPAAPVAEAPLTPGNAPTATEAPPPPQVEMVPVAPGPEYAWTPGYWSIGVGGRWVWMGGRYVVRPRAHAVWMGGRWARHGHGYVWVGGHWR